jgi:hypothetical protein
MASVMMPALEAARESEMRRQAMTNMKEIAMAMYMYEGVNNRFPPAAIRDKDGKPLLSWRVAILPYLDLKLYKEFHLDEPYDSEHNKALIAKMPALFRDPHEEEGSTNASYFMPMGKGMFGGDLKGMRMANITDGSANTIMLVEAKRDILPWTKPEDIEIDADATKPLPKLGGHMQPEGFFAAGFADGHIEGIDSSKVDVGRLHAMFTVGGGESLEIPGGSQGMLEPKPVRGKIEFRLAETEAGDGLSAAELPGYPNKFYLHSNVELSGDDLKESSITTDDSGNSRISIRFNAEGARKISKMTKANMGKNLAILVDGKLIAAPKIMAELSSEAQITGHFNKEDLQRITDALNGH